MNNPINQDFRDTSELAIAYQLRLFMQRTLTECASRLDKKGNLDLADKVSLIHSFWLNDEFTEVQVQVLYELIHKAFQSSENKSTENS